MKRLALLALYSLMLLQITACGFIYSLDRNLPDQIDEWIANDEYAKAMDALMYINKSHSQYDILQRKKTEVEQAARKYEGKQLKVIQTHIDQREWDQAEKLLNQSMEKLPDSKPLQTAYHDFVQKRAHYLKSLYYQLYINKAEWLVKNTDVQEELSRASPEDRRAQRGLDEHRKEVARVYQQLTICGIEAMNIGDLELAEQCFLLADELQPSKALQTTILDIQQQLATKQKRATLVLSERGRNVLGSAKQKMQEGNLKAALESYRKIPTRDQKHALVTAFKQELDGRISQNVTQGIELGRKLYSQGEIKQALAIWNNLRELDPDNQALLSHIKRAERVLHKVEELQQKGTTVKPPESRIPGG